MEEDRRICPRIDFHHGVVIKGFQGVKKTLNFSTGGVYIETEKTTHFKPGQKLDIVTRFPLEKKMVKLSARVVHVDEQGVGVKFEDLWGSDLATVENTFRVFQITVPFPNMS